jgi:ZIP family zinc transporter
MNIILIGTLASLIAATGTILGAALVFPLKNVSEKLLDAAMGFSAGVMIAVTFFGLIAPAIEIGGVWRAAFGIVIGTIFLIAIEKAIPHIHRISGITNPSTHLKKIWLLILAITIHNFPEGISVGVGFAGGDMHHGTYLATGIGIQNIVEGLIVALPLIRMNERIFKAFLVASCTCIVEPIGGFLGISAVTIAKFLTPYGLAFAAGAMLFVTCEEVIPESHTRGNARIATIGVIAGFILMMLLERIFS